MESKLTFSGLIREFSTLVVFKVLQQEFGQDWDIQYLSKKHYKITIYADSFKNISQDNVSGEIDCPQRYEQTLQPI